MAFEIQFAQPLNAELSRVFAEQFDFALGCLDNVAGDASADAIHEFRKTTKKLRALIRMLRSALPKTIVKKLLASLSSAAAHLSVNRDALVLERNLRRAYPLLLPDFTIEAEPWRELSLFEPYREGLIKASEGTSVQLARTELLALKAQLEESLFASVTVPQLLKGHTQCFRRARQLMSKLRSPVPMALMHRFRKRAKDNLYQLCLLKRLSPKRFRHDVRAFEKLASNLGDLNDLYLLLTAQETARERGGTIVELHGLKEWILARISKLEKRALNLTEPLYAKSPKKHHRELLAYRRSFLRAQLRRANDVKVAIPVHVEIETKALPKKSETRRMVRKSRSSVTAQMSP